MVTSAGGGGGSYGGGYLPNAGGTGSGTTGSSGSGGQSGSTVTTTPKGYAGGAGGASGVPGRAGGGSTGGAGGQAGTARSPAGSYGGIGYNYGGGGGGGGGYAGYSGAGSNLSRGSFTGGSGGAGGQGYNGGGGGAGGSGASVSGTAVDNVSALTGGQGGSGGFGAFPFLGGTLSGTGGNGGAGGAGFVSPTLFSSVTLTNAGSASGGVGGQGGYGGLSDGAGGAGGAGILFEGLIATLSNTGRATGGAGGSLSSTGGVGGIGVSFLGAESTLTNYSGGRIYGGAGGSGLIAGGVGGAGVAFAQSGGVLTNAGTIRGGAGGGPISGSGSQGTPEAGGAGVSGAGMTIVDTGLIAGGSGATQGDAIAFTGDASTLALGSAAVLSGALDIQGQTGTLTFDQSAGTGLPANVTVADAIIGAGAVIKASSGTLTLTAANSYAGGTTIDAGAISIASDGALGAPAGGLTLAGGTLETTATLASQRAVTLQGSGTIEAAAGTTTLSGVVSGAGALTETGAGSLTLSSANTYSGGTTVTAGTLTIASDSALGASGGPLSLTGGTLETTASFTSRRQIRLNGTGTIQVDAGTTLSLGGGITGTPTASLVKTGAGTLMLTGGNNYGGGTMIGAGTVSVTSDNSLGQLSGALTLATGTLETSGNYNSQRAIVLQTFGTIQVDSGTTTFSGVISGAGDLVKNGAGTLTLSGANTFTGVVLVNGGTLSVAADSALGASGGVLLTDATFDMTTGFASGRNIVIADTGTIEVDRGTTTLSGTINDYGQYGTLVKTGNGTLVLSGANSYSFGTAIDAGTVSVSSDANLGATSSDPLFGNVVFAGGTLETTASFTSQRAFIFNGAGTVQVDTGKLTLSGTISGNAPVIKTGAGTLTLSGTNTTSDGTSIRGGTLELATASAAGTGAIAFNSSSATLTVDGAAGLSNAITGFAQGDTLDLTGLAYAPGEHATLVGTTLTVSNGTASETFTNFSLAPGATLGQAGLVLADGSNGGAGSDLVLLTDTGISTPSITFAAANSAAGAADINAANASAVAYTVGSVDPYAVATVTFTGVSKATGQVASVTGAATNGTHTVNLSGFQDGTITATISDYDPAGNTASASATAMLATTTSYTGVATAQALSAGIAAIDLASQASGGTGTAFSITLAAGATLSGSAAASAITLSGNDTLTIKGDNATIAGGGLVLQDAQGVTFAADAGTTLTDADVISGTGSVVIDGGTVALTTANSYGGGTYVDSGTAAVSNTSAFGTGTVHLVDPSIEYQASGTYANAISLDQSGSAATPAVLIADSGVTATITGAITAGTGTNAQGIAITSDQSVLVAGSGTLVVGSSATPAATISGSTLEVNSGGFAALVSYVAPATVEKTQTTVIGTVTPGAAGAVLTLTQTAGSLGTVTLGAVQSNGTQQVIYTAPASVTASATGNVSYTIVDQTNTVVATGSNSVQLDAGPSAGTGAIPVIHNTSVNETSYIQSLVTPGLPGDTETIVAVTGAGATLTNGAVTYTAPATGLASFGYTVQDQYGGQASGQVNVTVLVNPAIKGTVAGQTTTSEAPVKPFSGVTIADANNGGNDTDTLTISSTGPGTLSGTGLTTVSAGVYTLTGTAATITGNLDKLVFTPVDGVANTSVTTNFTLSDASSAGTASLPDSTTTVKDTDPAVASAITGTHTASTASEKPVTPFTGATISDANAGGTDTLYIGTGGPGTLTDGAGFHGLTSTTASNIFTISGTAAAVTKELDALVFTPANGVPNTSVTTSFLLGDVNSAGFTTYDQMTVVTDTDPAVAPTITGTVAGQTTISETTVIPFAGVSITDLNNGGSDTDTLKISYTGPGTLSGTGLTKVSAGVYTLSGTAATITGNLDKLVFTPVDGVANTSVTTSFTLSDTSSADPTPALNTTASVTDIDPAVAPTITGLVPGQITGVAKPVSPFAKVMIADPNSGTADTAYLLIEGPGTLSGTGLSAPTYEPGQGNLYSVTAASLAVLNADVEGLVYTPVASSTHSVQTITFGFVDGTSAGTSAANSATTLTIDPGPVAGTLSSSLKLGASTDLTSAILGAATPGIAGDTLKITADSTAGTLGTLSLVNGDLVYSATGTGLSHIPANGSQADSFTYTLSDQYGDTSTGTVKITVSNPATVINGSIFGFSTIQGTPSANIITAYGFFDTIYDNGGNDVVNAGQGNAIVNNSTGDVVTNLSGFFNTVSGGNGNDTVSGSAGNTTIALGNGTDSVSAGGFSNTVTLGNGNDKVTGGQGAETIVLGNGNDAVTASGYSNTIKVGSGTNTIVNSNGGSAAVTAGAGTDTIALSGNNNSVALTGSTASVTGLQGGDSVAVNGGNDNLTFAGWNSQATLTGTTAASIMDLGNALRINIGSNTQTDTVNGFGSDGFGVVDLQNGAGGYSSVSQVIAALHSDGHGGTMLALGTTGSIDFAGTAASQLHASNFKIG